MPCLNGDHLTHALVPHTIRFTAACPGQQITANFSIRGSLARYGLLLSKALKQSYEIKDKSAKIGRLFHFQSDERELHNQLD